MIRSAARWLRRRVGQLRGLEEGNANGSKFDVADLNTGVVAVLKTANVTDNTQAQKIVPDRVHPGPAGHLIMAEQLLKAWHARPTVSIGDISAGAKPAVQ